MSKWGRKTAARRYSTGGQVNRANKKDALFASSKDETRYGDYGKGDNQVQHLLNRAGPRLPAPGKILSGESIIPKDGDGFKRGGRAKRK